MMIYQFREAALTFWFDKAGYMSVFCSKVYFFAMGSDFVW